LHNSNKPHLILTKFRVNNASFIGSQNAKFQLSLPTQTVVTAAFVTSLQKVKCLVLSNRMDMLG